MSWWQTHLFRLYLFNVVANCSRGHSKTRFQKTVHICDERPCFRRHSRHIEHHRVFSRLKMSIARLLFSLYKDDASVGQAVFTPCDNRMTSHWLANSWRRCVSRRIASGDPRTVYWSAAWLARSLVQEANVAGVSTFQVGHIRTTRREPTQGRAFVSFWKLFNPILDFSAKEFIQLRHLECS